MLTSRPLSYRLLACLGFAMVSLAPAGASAERDCTCRYAGQSYALGACLCINRPGAAPQYACCGMVLNNTSWKFSDGGCPVAMSMPVDPVPADTVFGDELMTAPESALPPPDRQ